MISKILCRLCSFICLIFFLTAVSNNLSAQGNCIKYDIIGGTAPKGDFIWVVLKFYNFDTVITSQFGIAYDPRVVMPVEKWATNKLPSLDTTNNNIFFDSNSKLVRVVWVDPTGGFSSLMDGDTFLMIKFKLIGEPGTCTPIYFSGPPIETEILDPAVNPYCVEEINPGDNEICVGQPVDLCVITYACGTLTNTGTVTIKPFGGTPPYIIERINPPGPNDTILNSGDLKMYYNLFPGLHQFRVRDSTGKDTLLDITIGIANSIAILPNGITQPHCLQDSNGVIDIRVIGGSGDLTIGWRPINKYGVTRVSGLKVGNYTVTVIDTAGCLASQDFLLFADTLFTQVEILKDATCADDGIVLARAHGGGPFPINKYDFKWSQNPAANTVDTVSINTKMSGKQYVVITDSRTCFDTVFFEVNFSGELLDSIVIDSIDCYDSTGTIHSFISSKGTLNGPMLFRLTDQNNQNVLGGQNGQNDYISPKLKAGRYYLEITDNAGCKRNDTIDLIQPPPLEVIDIQLDTTESCIPGDDAFVCVRGFGGTPTYSFKWCDSSMSSCVNMLSQGICAVTITDFKGCTATKSYTITQPNGPVIDSFSIVNPTCPNDKDGSVRVNYTAGSAPVTGFKWNVTGNNDTLRNRGTGIYIVTITDQNGCEAFDTAILSAGNSFRLGNFTLQDPSCYGLSNGFITVNVVGFKQPVTYQWDNNNQSAINVNLSAGTYCVTIDDAGTCPVIDTCFVLTDPPKVNIQLSGITPPSCANVGTCDGSAIAFLTGSDTAYQMLWSSGEQVFTRLDTAHLLCAGDQFVIGTSGSCSDTLLFNVPNAVPITIDTIISTPPRCYESNDGQITLLAEGGTGPYTYQWLNPSVPNSSTITNLGDGTFFVNIIDANNCSHLDSVRLRQPDSIRVDIILGSTLDVSCPGKSDGRITTAWAGGNRGKGTFQWTPNVNPPDSIATNLPAGRYELRVTDVNGCTGTNEYTILAPPAITFQMTTIDTPRCENDQIQFSILQANGGSGPQYRFTINNGAPNDIGDIVPLFSGNYNVRIYDKNNCSIDTNITILNPTNFLSLDFGKDFDTIQLGDSILLDGKLNSSTVIDTIIWSPSNSVSNTSSTSSFVSPSTNTLYTLTVIDENGCEVSDQITIVVLSTRKFYAPNVFSPNGDNINDYFSLQIGQGIKAIKSVQIFDRWGNKVYNLENPVIDAEVIDTWDGRFGKDGDLMNPAVFVYFAEVLFDDGTTIVYRGNLTLMR